MPVGPEKSQSSMLPPLAATPLAIAFGQFERAAGGVFHGGGDFGLGLQQAQTGGELAGLGAIVGRAEKPADDAAA